MIKAQQKIEDLGGINLHYVPDGDIASLTRIVNNSNGGLVLANENSMVDTYRIDSFDNGLVGGQSVDLEAKLGNPDVLNLIELMKSKKNVTFMPGTLLRDYGGYILPVMPVIQDGKLMIEKVKQTGIAYVDDYLTLKQKLIGRDSPAIEEVVRNEVAARRQDNFKSVLVNGLSVLPIICNELSLAPELYQGKPIDVILHSCEDLYSDNGKRIDSYQKILGQMKTRNQLSDSVVIATVEGGETPYKGTFAYENGIFRSLN
jgi:hypothetical protein